MSRPSSRGSEIRPLGGSGEPMVLLHPFALCAGAWSPIVPQLARKHRVFAGTYHGHFGGAPLPPGFRPSIQASVDLAAAELDAAGIDRAHLVGNSLGGWLALELARRGRALSVVALSPGGGWESGSAEELRLSRIFKSKRKLLRVGAPFAPIIAASKRARKIGLREVVADTDRLTHAHATLLIRASSRCTAYDGVVDAMPHEPAPLPMDPLPCPVRVVWGTRDWLLPVKGYSERWRRLLPGAEWLELDGAGHVPMYDDPDGVVRLVLEFTRDVAGRAAQREASVGTVPAREANGSASAIVSSRREPMLTSTIGQPASRSMRST